MFGGNHFSFFNPLGGMLWLSFCHIGSLSVKDVPSLFLLSKVISPPWTSTKRLTTARPKPCPFALVVNKGWKILGLTASGMPVPVSVTLMRAWLFWCVASMVISPFAEIAWTAFVMRFVRMRWVRERST